RSRAVRERRAPGVRERAPPPPPPRGRAREPTMASLEVKATSKYVRTSAQKAGLVLDLIRGKKAADALSILRFTKRAVARDIEKTPRSGVSHAVHRHQ